MSGRGRYGDEIGRIISSRGRGGRIKFNIRNNQNNIQKMKFYPHGTGPD